MTLRQCSGVDAAGSLAGEPSNGLGLDSKLGTSMRKRGASCLSTWWIMPMAGTNLQDSSHRVVGTLDEPSRRQVTPRRASLYEGPQGMRRQVA